MKKSILNTVIVIIFFIANNITAWAEPLPSDYPVNPDATGDEVAGAPIDNAILWLMIIGLIFGLFFIRNTLRKQTVTK